MRLITRLSLPVLAAMTLAVPAATRPSPDAQRFWPEWRGPLGTGEAPQATPPREWSTTKNIAWKVQVPGIGKSSPIIWGDLGDRHDSRAERRQRRRPSSSGRCWPTAARTAP